MQYYVPSATPVTVVNLQSIPQKLYDLVPLGAISAGIPIATSAIGGFA